MATTATQAGAAGREDREIFRMVGSIRESLGLEGSVGFTSKLARPG